MEERRLNHRITLEPGLKIRGHGLNCFTLININSASLQMIIKRLQVSISRERRLTEPERILIVDDESLARQRLRRYLANIEQGFLIAEADSGLTAVAQIQAFKPDVVFLDVEM